MKLIQILVDGTMNDINVEKITKKTILKVLKDFVILKEGSLKEICSWDIEDSKLICYSSTTGKKENNYKLMKDMKYKGKLTEKSKLYGDIFIIKTIKSKLHDIDIADYALIYSLQEEMLVDELSDYEYDEYEDDYTVYEDENTDEDIEVNEEDYIIKLPQKTMENTFSSFELDIDTMVY
jgi:hypothetical protein